jgi:outer membrane lipoprotein SlyB
LQVDRQTSTKDFSAMETKTSSSSSLHPMLWVAAISLTLLSFAGIASLTGLLPTKSAAVSTIAANETVPVYAALAPAAVPTPPLALPPAAIAPEPAPEVLPIEAPLPVVKKPVKKKVVAQATPHLPAETPPHIGSGVPPNYAPPPPVVTAPPAPPPCSNCGVISGIRQVAQEGQGTGLGVVAGGVLGGLLGNQVGNGKGRTLATIAGAVGGGYVGNRVEKSQRETVAYQISVRMEDGTDQVIESSSAPAWRTGDHVKLVNGAIVSR